MYYQPAVALILASLSVLEFEALFRSLLADRESWFGMTVHTEIKLYRLFAGECFW